MAVGASRASLDKNAYNSGRTLGITWLRSGNNANTNYAHCLTPSGGNSNNGVNGWLSVRPALHSIKTLTIQDERLVSSWLRSGNAENANNAYGLTPSGGNSNNWVNNWLSVRPALSLACKYK